MELLHLTLLKIFIWDTAHHFQKVLLEPQNIWMPSLNDLISIAIIYEENEELQKGPTKLELKKAHESIPQNSYSGLDGFNSGFLLACWEFLKDDLLEAATNFFNGTPLPKFFTTSYVVLISKILQPSNFDKFSPISLCLEAYKVF